MKDKKLLLIFLAGLIFQSTAAQVFISKPRMHAVKEGVWTSTTLDAGILKTTFTPKNYSHNEQISNAVLARAASKQASLNDGKISGDKEGNLNYTYAGKKIELPAYFESAGFRGFTFRLKKNVEIYGTGERSVPLNRRGYKLNLYNQPAYGYSMNAESLNYSVPFIISSDGYGIFFDNPSKSYLDIGKTNNDIMQYGASSGELTFYRIPGKNMDEILRKYQSLVGTQPIPARWVFGNLMSRFGYRSEAQLMSTVNKMKAENFPVDAVILDLFWFGDSIQGTLGNLDWKNKTAWPEPKKMIANLNQQGIKTILITEPFVLNTTPNYEVSKKFQAVDSAGDPFVLTTFYFGNGGLLDLFRKDAQDWFWSKYEPQIANGVTGWWGDLGEPETHPSTMNHNLKDLGFNRIFKADEVHNIYGHYWDKMLFDKYAKEYPSVRIFNLNRSGYAGSPRYGVFPWSGDVSRSWDGLKAQLPLMIGMSMSGVPYIHADAGGFAGGDGDKELYTRWLQFATFTPVFRPHGTALGNMDPNAKDIPSEAALYDDPYKSIVRRYMQLRYAMLPYNYTMAYQQAKFGKPLVRPLFYYGSSDSNLLKAGDEFMWGDEILVAPVLEKGVAERKIYFPEGNWYNLITDEKITGHKWGSEKTDINNIPVFVKEGSFVPLFISSDPVKNTGDYTGKDLTVKYYLSAQTSAYTMFDDDGITNNTLGKGNYELINFTGRAGTKKITVKISGSHKIIQATRNIKFLFPADSKIIEAMINNKPVLKNKTGSVMNEFKNREDLIEFQYSGKPLDIVITLQ